MLSNSKVPESLTKSTGWLSGPFSQGSLRFLLDHPKRIIIIGTTAATCGSILYYFYYIYSTKHRPKPVPYVPNLVQGPIRIIIVGAGLGGLALANTLEEAFVNTPFEDLIELKVIERDRGRRQGLTIGLRQEGINALIQINQQQLLKDLLVRPNSQDKDNNKNTNENENKNENKNKNDFVTDVCLIDERGKVLMKGFDMMKVKIDSNDYRSVLVNREAIRAYLLNKYTQTSNKSTKAKAFTLLYSKKVTGYRSKPKPSVTDTINNNNLINNSSDSEIEILIDNEESLHGDILIGADGARSVIRSLRCPKLIPQGLGIYSIAGVALIDKNSALFTASLVNQARSSLCRILGLNGVSLLFFSAPSADIPTDVYNNNNNENDNKESSENISVLWSLSGPMALFEDIINLSKVSSPDKDNKVSLAVKEIITKSFHDEARSLSTSLIDLSNSPFLAYELTSVEPSLYKDPNTMALDLTSTDPQDSINRYVTLLGDAAHKTTTQAGLGASGAFLDAADLASQLIYFIKQQPSLYGEGVYDKKGLELVLRKYEEKMKERAFDFVSQSINNTRMIHSPLENRPIFNFFIKGLLKSVGAIFQLVHSVKQFTWRK